MTTRTGEPEDPRIGYPLVEGRAPADAPKYEDQPEPVEIAIATCHYCGGVFAGAGDDCGGCRLTGEDLDAYARDRATPAAPTWYERRFSVCS